MFRTNRSPADLADRSGLMITKRAFLSIIPDHFSSGRLENLSVGLACGYHLNSNNRNVQQLNASYRQLVATTKKLVGLSSDHILGNPSRRDRDRILHFKLRR